MRLNNLRHTLAAAEDRGFVFAVDLERATVVPIPLSKYVTMASSDPLLAYVRISKPEAERKLAKLLGLPTGPQLQRN